MDRTQRLLVKELADCSAKLLTPLSTEHRYMNYGQASLAARTLASMLGYPQWTEKALKTVSTRFLARN